MKKRLNAYLDRILSRRFQVLVLAVVIFFVTNKFSGQDLLWVFMVYIGFDTAEKFVNFKKG